MSPSLRQRESKRIWLEISNAAAAAMLAAASFFAFLSQYALTWDLSSAFKGGMVSGLVSVWNRIGEILGNTNYVILTQYQGAGEEYGAFLTVTLVLMVIAAFLAVRSRFLPLAFLFVLPHIATALIFSLYPKIGYVIFSAAAVMTALAVMKLKGGFLRAICLPAAAAALTVLLVFAVGTENPLVTGTQKAGTAAGAKLFDFLYGYDDLGHGDLSERKREIRDGNALEVSMSKPQSMYLKGFTGGSFDGTKWSDLTNTAYYQALELMSALEAEGFHAPGQLAQASSYVYEDIPENEISVKNVGADSRYIFVPYDITARGDLSAALTKGGSEFYTGKLNAWRSYRYMAAENQVDNWTESAAGFFVKALGTGEERAAAGDYLRLESYYNAFVYENFTQLSAADRKILAANIGSAGDQSEGHMDYKLAIAAVRDYLDSYFIYSEDLGKQTENENNGLKEFFSSHKGYDVHYATAATLMFRYYGIPARYAEGYLITPEDVRNAGEGDTIPVSRANAHAWTEIYIDGVGFVPLEVTPEFYGIMEETDMTVGISNEALAHDFQELYGNKDQNDSDDESDQSDGNEGGDQDSALFWIVLAVIAGAGIVIFCVFLIKFLIAVIIQKEARKKLFLKSDPKTAVAAIYGYMEEKELRPGPEAVFLGNLAAYSPVPVSEQDRTVMLGFLKALKKNKKRINGNKEK